MKTSQIESQNASDATKVKRIWMLFLTKEWQIRLMLAEYLSDKSLFFSQVQFDILTPLSVFALLRFEFLTDIRNHLVLLMWFHSNHCPVSNTFLSIIWLHIIQRDIFVNLVESFFFHRISFLWEKRRHNYVYESLERIISRKYSQGFISKTCTRTLIFSVFVVSLFI